MIVTESILELARSSRGGWTKAQLAIIGVKWPPRHGWMGRVIGKEFPDRDIERFLSESAAIDAERARLMKANPSWSRAKAHSMACRSVRAEEHAHAG